jgi:hypothetical protein
MHSYSVRTFRDGDEKEIVGLFNEVYKGYGGFVPRTIEYWRWCCLERPDVERDGILLAFDEKKLCGYLVAGSSGNIWEFCVADDEVARVLLAEALSYLEKVEVSSVNINIPQNSSIAETLIEAGFGKVPAETMFITTLNPQALVSTLAAFRKEELINKKINDEFGVQLHDAPHSVETEFSVKIRGETVEVVEGFPSKPSVVIALSFVDFLSVLFGFSNAGRLFLVGKMKVKPLWKLSVVLKLLSAFRFRRSWFFPLSDFG